MIFYIYFFIDCQPIKYFFVRLCYVCLGSAATEEKHDSEHFKYKFPKISTNCFKQIKRYFK